MNVLEQIVVSGSASPDGIINAGNTFKTLQSSMKKRMVEAICGFDRCYSQYFGGH